MNLENDVERILKVLPPSRIKRWRATYGWLGKPRSSPVMADYHTCHVYLKGKDLEVKTLSNKGVGKYEREVDKSEFPYVFSLINTKLSEDNGVSGETRERFLEWLVKDSPWRSIFVGRYEHALIADAEADANLLASGLVASRTLWYYSGIVKVWDKLVNAGVNPTTAYLLAHSIDINSSGKISPSNVDYECPLGRSYSNRHNLKSLREVNYHPIGSHRTTTYGEWSKMWSVSPDWVRVDENLPLIWDEFVKEVVNGTKVRINPFSINESTTVKWDRALGTDLSQWLKEKEKEWLM